ncbi:MAG: DUF2867 domain-containing protein [Spartobacteria bacterium]
MSSQWDVHKFGGTSLASADHYRGVTEILRAAEGGRKAIVVSAMAKVTDTLIELVELARTRDDGYRHRLALLKERHAQAAEALLVDRPLQDFLKVLESDCSDIGEVLRGVYLSRTCSERTLELITGHGELWSAQLLDAHLRAEGIGSSYLDARTILTVDPGENTVSVDWARSQAQTNQWLAGLTSEWVVVTGFVASTPDGIPTTLKRNGSDFSASIFGKLLGARSITIWTDVDGVLSADPRLVPDAIVTPVMLTTHEGMIIERRQMSVDASADSIFRAFTGLGGKRGWLYLNWTWRIRGALDRLCGGVGMRRGRRDADNVRVGEALDFWRVEAIEPGQLMRLRAEMKVPGKAWLQFEVRPQEADARPVLTQTAFFAPKGLFGLAYWYLLYPIHGMIFGGMIRELAARAMTLDAQRPLRA